MSPEKLQMPFGYFGQVLTSFSVGGPSVDEEMAMRRSCSMAAGSTGCYQLIFAHKTHEEGVVDMLAQDIDPPRCSHDMCRGMPKFSLKRPYEIRPSLSLPRNGRSGGVDLVQRGEALDRLCGHCGDYQRRMTRQCFHAYPGEPGHKLAAKFPLVNM